MGILADIIRQKFSDGRESRRINEAVARAALAGTDPSRRELRDFTRGRIDGTGETDRRRQLFAASQNNQDRAAKLRQLFSLERAGLDPSKIRDFDNANASRELLNTLSTSEKADFLNKKSIAPTSVAGGVVFDRFGDSDQHVQATPSALADIAKSNADAYKAKAGANKLNAETDQIAARTGELKDFFARSDGFEGVDAANKRAIADAPQKVTVVDENGKEKTVFAEKGPDGVMRVLSSNEQLFRPKSATNRLSKSQATLWQESVTQATSELSKSNFGETADVNEIQNRALETFRLKVNDPTATPPGGNVAPSEQPIDLTDPANQRRTDYQVGQTVTYNGRSFRVIRLDADTGEPVLGEISNENGELLDPSA